MKVRDAGMAAAVAMEEAASELPDDEWADGGRPAAPSEAGPPPAARAAGELSEHAQLVAQFLTFSCTTAAEVEALPLDILRQFVAVGPPRVSAVPVEQFGAGAGKGRQRKGRR